MNRHAEFVRKRHAPPRSLKPRRLYGDVRTVSRWEQHKGCYPASVQANRNARPRAKSIWYGEARRIEAAEMDQLRRGAESAKLAQALAGVETLRSILAPCIPNADRILAELASALRAHGVGKNELGQQWVRTV